jgi:hypothetical protein
MAGVDQDEMFAPRSMLDLKLLGVVCRRRGMELLIRWDSKFKGRQLVEMPLSIIAACRLVLLRLAVNRSTCRGDWSRQVCRCSRAWIEVHFQGWTGSIVGDFYRAPTYPAWGADGMECRWPRAAYSLKQVHVIVDEKEVHEEVACRIPEDEGEVCNVLPFWICLVHV